MRSSLFALSAAWPLALAGPTLAEAPKVVVSIKPLHSLVASVMAGVGEPKLIVDGAASPHTFSMTPSNAADLSSADVVFWAGDGMEMFLVKPLESLGSNAKVVELIDSPGIAKLTFREGGAFEADDDEPVEAEHAGEHDHGTTDMHFWLDPLNAKAAADEIERTLAAVDPANAAVYKANAETLDARLDRLVETTAAEVAPVKTKPFVVFHDAYQYFERRFGVRAAGSITVSPETAPGARRLSEIEAKVKSLGATCVFAEPQFEPKLVEVVIEGTDAHTGTLDPEGGALEKGPDLYFQLIERIGASLRDCLSRPS